MADHHPDSHWEQAYDHNSSQLPPDDLLLSYVSHLEPGHALDFGCGTGGNSVALARAGWSVHGVDFTKKAIEVARAQTPSELEVAYEVGDMTTWSRPDTFDLVLISYALPPEGAERKAALARAYESLVSGGTVLLAEFDADTMGWGNAGDFATVDGIKADLEAFDSVTVESVATKGHDHAGKSSHSEGEQAVAVIGLGRRPS